jgi:hypothetical protein
MLMMLLLLLVVVVLLRLHSGMLSAMLVAAHES